MTMYIRWVVRRHKNESTANVVFYDAYLVESYRDERNNPRQHTICYLGNIRQIDGAFPTIERELFLIRAERILVGASIVPPEERESILQLLHRKVPALTVSEVQVAFRNNLSWYYRWRLDHGGAPSREELLQLIDSAADTIGSV
jgi:hypothetical protein